MEWMKMVCTCCTHVQKCVLSKRLQLKIIQSVGHILNKIVCVCIYLVVVYRAWAVLMFFCLHIYICPVFFQLIYILCHYHLILQSIPSIYTSLRETVLFVLFKEIPLKKFFLCPLKHLISPLLLNIRSFISVSSRFFINLYIVIKSPLFCVFT